MTVHQHRWIRRCVLLALAVLPIPVALAPTASADDVQPGSTVVGTVVHAYVEHKDEADAGAQSDFGAPLTYVKSTSGDPVRVPTSELQDVPVGATVAVKVGGDVQDAPAQNDQLDPAKQVLSSAVVAPAPAAAAPATTDTVSIAMVAPLGTVPDATTLATVVGQVAGPVTQFWAAQSSGAIQLAVGDTHDWGTTTAHDDCSDPEALWSDVAQQIGFTPGPGKHLMLYLPNNSPGCAYGLAEVGASLHAGGYLYVQDTLTSVIAHELGHNFGLLHSGREECQGAVDTGACSTIEYGDYYDVMGASWDQVGSLNAAQSARLGFLPSAEVQSVTAASAPATYTLAPLSAGGGIRAIRLTGLDGSVYYLEYRGASGQDAYLADPSADWLGLPAGVLLHRVETSSAADSAMLLDGTPTPDTSYAQDQDDVLPVNQPVAVAGGTFELTVEGASVSGATVEVTPGSGLQSWSATADRLPMGNWDGASASGTALTVSGWVFDPDSPAAASPVHVYVDGVGTALTANGSRPDVGAVFPQAGAAHGFSWSTTVTPGVHTVCVYAIDVQLPSTHTTLGCRTVQVAMTLPVGNWEGLSASGTTLSVSGWVFDPDSPAAASPVHVYVDGVGTALTGNGSRPDVGAVFPQAGAAHGFSWSTTVTPGVHTVCVYAIDVQQPWTHTTLGCRTLTASH